MNRIIEILLMGIVITCTNMYLWSKLIKKKPNFKSIKTYIIFIFMMITTLINYFYNNQFIKIVTITGIMIIFFKILFNEKINKSVLCVVTSQLIYMVSEVIFAFILMYIFRVDSNDFVQIYFGRIITNFVVATICIIIIQVKFVNKFYINLLKITSKIKTIHIIVLLFIIMLTANIFTMTLYYKLNFVYIIVFNTSLTIACLLIVLNSFKNKNNYIKVYDKYNTTLNSLKEYEDILDKYRVSNHENKNQLLTIRNMLPKNNKKIKSYIDTIVNNKLKDNDKVMLDVTRIPEGGLRGLIYSKLLTMKELNIDYELEISKEVKTVDLINKIDDLTMLDICKIIGVYVDNSIQAVENLDEKYVNIEMYLDRSKLIIAISNNYEGIIEMDKLENSGYTTKEKGHGYGLTLARELIDNNKKLSNEKMITKETFTQILKIKM